MIEVGDIVSIDFKNGLANLTGEVVLIEKSGGVLPVCVLIGRFKRWFDYEELRFVSRNDKPL